MATTIAQRQTKRPRRLPGSRQSDRPRSFGRDHHDGGRTTKPAETRGVCGHVQERAIHALTAVLRSVRKMILEKLCAHISTSNTNGTNQGDTPFRVGPRATGPGKCRTKNLRTVRRKHSREKRAVRAPENFAAEILQTVPTVCGVTWERKVFV